MDDMVLIEGGTFLMGSDEFYPDERPVHERAVDTFRIDRHAVTNEEFAAFVDDTGYSTVAERELDPAGFPGANPVDLVPGSMVFTPTAGPVDLGPLDSDHDFTHAQLVLDQLTTAALERTWDLFDTDLTIADALTVADVNDALRCAQEKILGFRP